MPDILKPIWSFMQKIGRFLKNTWASMSAYVLYIRARFASKPDGFEETMNRIRANDFGLTRVDLRAMRLSYWNIIELCYALASNTRLESLYVSWNQIGAAGAQSLAQALARNTALRLLNIERVGWGGYSPDRITWSLSFASADDLYAVPRLNPKPDGFEETMNRIRVNDPQLTHLDLSSMRLSSWDVIELCSALATNTTLTSLNVSDSRICAVGAQVLAANTTLTSLNLSGNSIGDSGAQALASNTTLTSLDVSWNEISYVGALALASNTALRLLNVEGVGMHYGPDHITWSSASADELYAVARLAPKPDGFEETMNRIRVNDPQLTHLDLRSMRLSSWNVIELCSALATNTTLTSLDVSHNQISAVGAKALAANTTLTSLNVAVNRIGVVGAQALAANTTLTSLDVSHNEIGEAGVQALANNTTLTSLNVSWNGIGATGAQALAANTTLTSLNVSWNGIDPANDLLLTNAIIRNIETKKTMARLHAFASIANNDHQSPQRLFEDIVQKVCSFLTTDAECLTNIRLRAAERSSRHVLFQPAGTVDSTREPIQTNTTAIPVEPYF